MKARYDSQCYACGRPIAPGQQIAKVYVPEGSTWVHTGCDMNRDKEWPTPLPEQPPSPLAILTQEVDRVCRLARPMQVRMLQYGKSGRGKSVAYLEENGGPAMPPQAPF